MPEQIEHCVLHLFHSRPICLKFRHHFQEQKNITAPSSPISSRSNLCMHSKLSAKKIMISYPMPIEARQYFFSWFNLPRDLINACATTKERLLGEKNAIHLRKKPGRPAKSRNALGRRHESELVWMSRATSEGSVCRTPIMCQTAGHKDACFSWVHDEVLIWLLCQTLRQQFNAQSGKFRTVMLGSL